LRTFRQSENHSLEYGAIPENKMTRQRLQKILAAAGIDSRRNCEQLILEGLVRVNNKVVDTLPAFADLDIDVITVNSQKIRSEQKVYFLLNKPDGAVCSDNDPAGRKKVRDFIDTDRRLIPAGRLDAGTAGLVILTNDIDLATSFNNRHFELPQSYVARIKGQIRGEDVEKLKKGVWLDKGRTSRAAVKILSRSYKESAVEITIRQGLNSQVRTTFLRLGLSVKSLARTRIGKLTVKGLAIGRYRVLTDSEVTHLKQLNSKSS
jgi:23S rRNA pseudouridine2605 synthase